MEKIQRILMIGLVFLLLFNGILFSSNEIEDAQTLARQGEYQKAYEKLLVAIGEMEGEMKNLQGLVQYYKDELTKLNNPPQVMDYSYNESANRLWASAWNLQHDGIFKKTGNEKEEYLQKAVDLYKRIVIDYPNSNKAEEAQYRIGRIYYKFIKDNQLAEIELQRYLNMYPKGMYASDVREILDRIKK